MDCPVPAVPAVSHHSTVGYVVGAVLLVLLALAVFFARPGEDES